MKFKLNKEQYLEEAMEFYGIDIFDIEFHAEEEGYNSVESYYNSFREYDRNFYNPKRAINAICKWSAESKALCDSDPWLNVKLRGI